MLTQLRLAAFISVTDVILYFQEIRIWIGIKGQWKNT